MKKNYIAIGSLLLSSVILVATGRIVFGYWRMPNKVKSIGDWIILLIPLIVPILSLLLIFVVLSNRVISKFTNGLFVGALIGSSIYMLFSALQLAFRFDMIAKDGTAYWGIMALPAIFLGIPLLFFGAIIGSIVGLKTEKENKT